SAGGFKATQSTQRFARRAQLFAGAPVGAPSAAGGVASVSGAGAGTSSGLSLFRIVFSGSSGNAFSIQSPICSSSGRDLASDTQLGDLSPTSQLKNISATATTRMPRAAP